MVLVDCLTLWLSNLMLAGQDVEAATAGLLAALEGAAVPVVLVSNEVGMGLVPETPLGWGIPRRAGAAEPAGGGGCGAGGLRGGGGGHWRLK